MSRTTRKRRLSFEEYYKSGIYDWRRSSCVRLSETPLYDPIIDKNTTFIKQHKAKYYSKTEPWYSFSLPKYYRKMVNCQRRTKDKYELWKEINTDYENQCGLWNGKTSNKWGYW